MARIIEIDKLKCLCSDNGSKDRIAYILYPMDILANWIEPAARKYGVTIVVITGMDWQNVFSPWKAPGVPKGSPDFEGESPEFLTLLRQKVIPQIEKTLDMNGTVSVGLSDNNGHTLSPALERSLVGVSMSGLFALWQWMECDTFLNIASLSGSFWYEGFLDWMKDIHIPEKSGLGYFLLGSQEANTDVKAFRSVGVNTEEIIKILDGAGIRTQFQSVPGNHYSDPVPRLNNAFHALYSQQTLPEMDI